MNVFRNTKYTLEEAKQIYLEHNLEFLENEYKNARFPHLSKCLICNHEWKTRLDSVKRNINCPECYRKKSGDIQRMSLEVVKQICFQFKVEFLDDVYINNQFPHNGKCLVCKHERKIYFCNIKKQGCPKCSGKLKHTLEQVKQIYLEHNLEYLDNTYKRCGMPQNTKCLKCNHKWKINLNNVRYERGCPNCFLRKNEKLTGQFLNELFPNTEIKPKIFNIQIFDENQLKIRDKFVVDYHFILNNQEIIVEYNGDQHYKPTQFFGGVSLEEAKLNFKNQQIRDDFLRNYCKTNSIKLIEIDGRKYKNNKIKKYLMNEFNIVQI